MHSKVLWARTVGLVVKQKRMLERLPKPLINDSVETWLDDLVVQLKWIQIKKVVLQCNSFFMTCDLN